MGYYITVFCLACLVSLILTPLVRELAIRANFVDRPDHRKHHRKPIALGGGTAVFAAALVAAVLTFLLAGIRGWENLVDAQRLPLLIALGVASGFMALVGVLDDAARLRLRYKVLAQLLAAAVVVAFGVMIRRVSFFGMTVELGLLAIPFSIFWLVGAINAMNLIDGADGVASSIGVVLCLAIAVMSILQGHPADAMVSLSLAGALVGFLCYNFPPASIFLGDSGSMLIGLVVGSMAISSSIKSAATVALAVPVAIWAVPILDSGAAILRRKLTGRSLFSTDRGHLHHMLLQRGWTSRGTLAFITLLAGVTSGAALLSVHFHNEWIAVLVLAVVLSILCATRVFGHVEMTLVANSARRAVAKGWTRPRQKDGSRPSPLESQVRLQGTYEWDVFWAGLTEAGERFGLVSIRLSIHLPAMEEAYYAAWQCPGDHHHDRLWTIVMPLVMQGSAVGRLVLSGEAGSDEGSLSEISDVVDFLQPVEEQLEQLAGTLSARRTPEPVDAAAS